MQPLKNSIEHQLRNKLNIGGYWNNQLENNFNGKHSKNWYCFSWDKLKKNRAILVTSKKNHFENAIFENSIEHQLRNKLDIGGYWNTQYENNINGKHLKNRFYFCWDELKKNRAIQMTSKNNLFVVRNEMTCVGLQLISQKA